MRTTRTLPVMCHNKAHFILTILITAVIFPKVFAQSEIPIGTWRLHLSYHDLNDLAIGDNKIFGASESGVLVFDRTDNSLTSYNKLTGLSSTGISCIAYDAGTLQLLIAYEDGNLDIIHDNIVTTFNRLKNSTAIAGSKKINHISINDGLAYMAADFGIVVFDLLQLSLKETWRNIGPAGTMLKINETTFLNDSIFAATEKGIMAGNLNNNLLDFNNWKRFDTDDLSGPVESIASFNNSVYAALDGQGLFRKNNGNWIKMDILPAADFNAIRNGNNHLLITESKNVWRVNTTGVLSAVTDGAITSPGVAIEDAGNVTWIADSLNGLISDVSGSFQTYVPNGPSIPTAFRLKFNNGKMYALAGGFTATGEPQGRKGVVNYFENGTWSVIDKPMTDLTDIDFINGETFTSSFGDGLEASGNGTVTLFDHTNSPLFNEDPAGKSVNISAIESFHDALWVANYDAPQPLHLFRNNSWESFALPPSARYPTDLAVDSFGNIWMVLDPGNGGGLLFFDVQTKQNRYLTEVTGNGALPARSVSAIAVDRDGTVWVGTHEGVAYFFSSTNDAVKPIFENRFLLRDEKVTAITVDGGNRKWIGTERGVWLVGPTGESLILNFTTENSPLPSDIIGDIGIHDQTGEVFFSTDKGIVSYRADATSSGLEFQKIKIFPNPVTSAFSGSVGITGLATDAVVKITDISGRLIWQTQANGGTATWDIRDSNGARAATGVYIVFAATADGADSVVGKIAVVD